MSKIAYTFPRANELSIETNNGYQWTYRMFFMSGYVFRVHDNQIFVGLERKTFDMPS